MINLFIEFKTIEMIIFQNERQGDSVENILNIKSVYLHTHIFMYIISIQFLLL